MKMRAGNRLLGFCCAMAGVMIAPAIGLAGEKFELTSAVPDGVFLCVAGLDNPERHFVDAYWSEVFDALAGSGITEDLMNMVGSMGGEEQQAEAEKFKQMGMDLFAAVDWGKMCGKEFVFAERLPKLVMTGNGMHVGPPDLLVLCRGTEGSGQANFEGLVKILNTILQLAVQAGAPEIPLQMAEQHGAKTATLAFGPPGSGMFLILAQRGDVILIGMGEIANESLALMAGTGDAKPLSSTARFKEAFTSLPEPEDEIFYMDVQRLVADIRAITDKVIPAIGGDMGGDASPKEVERQDVFHNTGGNKEASDLVRQAYAAYEGGDHDKALELTKLAYAKDPTDSVVMYNLACFSALKGESENAILWLDKAVDGGFHAPNKIAGDSDLASLRSDPLFDAILTKANSKLQEASGEAAPEAEEGDGPSGPQWAGAVQRLVDRLLGTLGMMDYVASVGYTEGHTTHSSEITVLTDDANKQPFYAVFGQRKLQTDFAKYLPVETTSFTVEKGLDLMELYKFLEDSIRLVGPEGEMILEQWAGIQQQMGFDVRKDLLSWLQGDMIEVSLRLSSGDASVTMIRVTDEKAAAEKVAAALEFATTALAEMASSNPMMGMLAVRSAPATHEKLPGFHNIFMQMSPQPMVVGVAQGYIMLASSEQAAALCLATAAGEHDNVTKNDQVMSEALVPDGPFTAVSFTDMRQLGAQISQAIGMIQMVGGMASMGIPDPAVQKIVSKIMGMVGKLIPAAQKIDFYKSSASHSTFDGKVIKKHSITNYQDPATRAKAAASADTAEVP